MAVEIATAAPLAVQGAKEVINFSRDKSIRDGLAFAGARNCLLLKSADVMEALAAFVQKRQPDFQGK